MKNSSEINQEFNATIMISLTIAKNPQRRFFPCSDDVTAISIYKMQRNILKTQNMHWIKCIFYFLHDQPYLTWLYENTNEQKQDPDIIYKLVLHHFRVHRIANIKIKTLDYLLTTLHHILNAKYHNLHIHVCVNLK